jgi:hypothetical protein
MTGGTSEEHPGAPAAGRYGEQGSRRESTTVAGAAARGDEGAFAAVLPAADEVWVDDDRLAADLGLPLTTSRPDVAVLTAVSSLAVAPTAPTVVLLLDGTDMAVPSLGRAGDAATRLAAHARVRLQVQHARRLLGRQGHGAVRVLAWDHGAPLRHEGHPPRAGVHRPERYPRRAVVVAGDPSSPLRVDEVLAVLGHPPLAVLLDRGVPVLPSPGGTLLLPFERDLLRVGLGRGRGQVEDPAAVLARLAAADLGPAARARVPALREAARTGPLSWSYEQRLPGSDPRPPLSPALLDDCADFLAALHSVRDEEPPRALPTAALAGCASRPDVVRALARRAEERVRGLPLGFGHRDFWHRNLLVQDGRLSGVVDWDSAARATLPFLDLLHLVTAQAQRPGGHTWGRAVVEELLPWAQRGGDAHARRYAAMLELPLDPSLLRALVDVYCLEWLDYQLTRYADRRADGRWLRGNVATVVSALTVSGSPR